MQHFLFYIFLSNFFNKLYVKDLFNENICTHFSSQCTRSVYRTHTRMPTVN